MEPPPPYEIAIGTIERFPEHPCTSAATALPPEQSLKVPPLRPPPPKLKSSSRANIPELGGYHNLVEEQKRMVAEAHQRAAAEERREYSLGGFETIALEQKRMVEEAHMRQAQMESGDLNVI